MVMENREDLIVGVDIGGTKVAAGLVNGRGEILSRTRTSMNATGDAAQGLAAVSEAIGSLFPGDTGAMGIKAIQAIGICAPGPLNPITGVILNPPNLRCWHNYPLAAEMKKLYGVPVEVENDANAAALAEVKWGSGRGYRNVFYATIGTGIGTGIIFDGKIYHGRTGAAGEGGHMGIDSHGPVCACGKRGCIETLAAGPGIARRARQRLAEKRTSVLLELAGGDVEKVNSQMVAQAASMGDAVAAEVMSETLDLLAYWLGNIVDLLEPDIIVMGGGVSSMLAPHLEEIRQRWRGACLNPAALEIPLVIAKYGEDAGIAGAASLAPNA